MGKLEKQPLIMVDDLFMHIGTSMAHAYLTFKLIAKSHDLDLGSVRNEETGMRKLELKR